MVKNKYKDIIWKKEKNAVIYSHYMTKRKYVRIDFGVDQRWFVEVDPKTMVPDRIKKLSEK